jgi:hypothetical protein
MDEKQTNSREDTIAELAQKLVINHLCMSLRGHAIN